MIKLGDHKPQIALTWLKKFVFVMSLLLHCDFIKTPSVQTWFVYFFVSVQPSSTNFESVSPSSAWIKICFRTKPFWLRSPKRDKSCPNAMKKVTKYSPQLKFWPNVPKWSRISTPKYINCWNQASASEMMTTGQKCVLPKLSRLETTEL